MQRKKYTIKCPKHEIRMLRLDADTFYCDICRSKYLLRLEKI